MDQREVEKFQRRRGFAGGVLPEGISLVKIPSFSSYSFSQRECDAQRFRYTAALPVCDEEVETVQRLLDSLSLSAEKCGIAVDAAVVINHSSDASEAQQSSSIRLCHAFEQDEVLKRRNNIRLSVLYAPGIRNGVGEARAIAMDFAVSRMYENGIIDEALIFSVDADAPVAADYFTEIIAFFEKNREFCGVTAGFRHADGETPEAEKAIRHYEKYLNDYVESLRKAGSPYGFHTIGSAFACRAAAYIRAGGMKKRRAGEDFYFLQELAKIGKVGEIGKVLVFPSSRISARVPFGTGPAMYKMLALGEYPQSYPPRAFEELGRVLRGAYAPAALFSTESFSAALEAAGVSLHSVEFLKTEGFFEIWPGVIRNQPAEESALRRQFDKWFDGLRTLRFIHSFSPTK
jgi:hypothetical protein